MEKLLHERLSDAARIVSHVKTLNDIVPIGKGSDGNDLFCQREAVQVIADEIERYYIPRPRFEDGEPVQFGDDIEIYNRSGLLDKGIIQSFHPNRGTVWMLSLVGCDHERLVRFDPDTCVIKRPTPKVYDADGVEIKVGDTVYVIHSGFKQTITRVENGKVYGSSDPKNIPLSADVLTHEKPVFDADGERIKVGDTVYEGNETEPLKVVRICKNGDVEAIGDGGLCSKLDASNYTHERPVFDAEGVRYVCGEKVWSLGGIEYIVEEIIDADHIRTRFPDSEIAHATFTSRTLTHCEPDSLEKLRDDITGFLEAGFPDDDVPMELATWASRLTAIIERDA